MSNPEITDESFPDGFCGPVLCPVCEEGHIVGYRDTNTLLTPAVPSWYLQCINGCESEIADAHCMNKNKQSVLERYKS